MPKRRQKKIKSNLPERSKRTGNKGNEEIIQEQENNLIEFTDEKTEQEKKLLMWVGVSCLMVIFFVAWIINLKYEFKVSLNKSAGNGFNWSQTRVELDKAMTQVKQGLVEIKKIQASSGLSAQAGKNALFGDPKLTAEQIDSLKGRLLNEIATGTASSTKK